MSTFQSEDAPAPARGHWWFRGPMLLLWAAVSFGSCYFARDLAAWHLGPWGGSLGYWMAAQGAVLMFLVIVVLDALVMNRLEAPEGEEPADGG